MPRQVKKGLDFYYKDVHEWESFAMMDLMEEYGPIGCCIYEVVLAKVYENGYYLEITVDKLALYVLRTIGHRWIADKKTVVDVIRFCAGLGLFDEKLLSQSVVTSAEIQRHYSLVSARRKADKSRYWLLTEGGKKDKSSSQEKSETEKNGISSSASEDTGSEIPTSDDVLQSEVAEIPDELSFCGINAAEIQQNDAEMHQRKENKSKQNKSKANKSKAKQTGAAAAAMQPESHAEELFTKLTGRRMTSTDREALEQMVEAGADDALIVRVMQRTAERHTAVSSMKYYVPIVLEEIRGARAPVRPYSPAVRTNAMVGLCPETSDMDDVEKLLDEEWAETVASYDGDYLAEYGASSE